MSKLPLGVEAATAGGESAGMVARGLTASSAAPPTSNDEPKWSVEAAGIEDEAPMAGWGHPCGSSDVSPAGSRAAPVALSSDVRAPKVETAASATANGSGASVSSCESGPAGSPPLPPGMSDKLCGATNSRAVEGVNSRVATGCGDGAATLVSEDRRAANGEAALGGSVINSSRDEVERSCSPIDETECIGSPISEETVDRTSSGLGEGFLGKRKFGKPVSGLGGAGAILPDHSGGGDAAAATRVLMAAPLLAKSAGVECAQTGGRLLPGSLLPESSSSEVESANGDPAMVPLSQDSGTSWISGEAKPPGTLPSSDAGWLELEKAGCCVLPTSETTPADFETRVGYSQEPALEANLVELAAVLTKAAAPERQPTMAERRFLPSRRIETLLIDPPASFPKTPLPGFATTEFFSKLDIDTLLFCFHHQQKTYQQILAAEQLRQRSWVLHRELRTWCPPEED